MNEPVLIATTKILAHFGRPFLGFLSRLSAHSLLSIGYYGFLTVIVRPNHPGGNFAFRASWNRCAVTVSKTSPGFPY